MKFECLKAIIAQKSSVPFLLKTTLCFIKKLLKYDIVKYKGIYFVNRKMYLLGSDLLKKFLNCIFFLLCFHCNSKLIWFTYDIDSGALLTCLQKSKDYKWEAEFLWLQKLSHCPCWLYFHLPLLFLHFRNVVFDVVLFSTKCFQC